MTLILWNALSLVILLLSIWWFVRQWRRVEQELKSDASPSGAKAFMKLFGVALVLMFVVLAFSILAMPWIAGVFKTIFGEAKEPWEFSGTLINNYSTGLGFVFSIPTALAGSVVAILLALRALRSADDIKELTRKQNELMQEQNSLQAAQTRLGQAQSSIETQRVILREVDEVHRLYYELCDALNAYFSVVRRVVFSFWESGVSGIKSDRVISLIDDEQFSEIDSSRERFRQALKSIAASPAGCRLWKKLAQSQSTSLVGTLSTEMLDFSMDKPIEIRLSSLPNLVYHSDVYCHARSQKSLNKIVHEMVLSSVLCDHVWRASYSAAQAIPVVSLLGKSIYRSDGKSPHIEVERLEHLFRMSWECAGESTNGSYLERACMQVIEALQMDKCNVLFILLARELRFVPESVDDFRKHLIRVSKEINDILGGSYVDPEVWFDEVVQGSESVLPDLDQDARSRGYLVTSGCCLALFDGYDFHNVGAAILADIIRMMPDHAVFVGYLRALFGTENEEVVDHMLATKAIDLDIRSFLPAEFSEASEWLQEHPVLPIISAFTFGKADEFDKLFAREKFDDVSGEENRKSLLRGLGLSVGGYQERA